MADTSEQVWVSSSVQSFSNVSQSLNPNGSKLKKARLPLCASMARKVIWISRLYISLQETRPRDSLFDQRCRLRSRISQFCRSADTALTILGGDFNYVTEKEGRWTKHSAEWSGEQDVKEEFDWELKIGKTFHMCEMHRPHATHDCAMARSRLDRVYTSQHCCDQLDFALGCAALGWDPKLSADRPVVFFKKRNKPRPPESGALPDEPLKCLSWPRRVVLAFQEKIRTSGVVDDPLHDLFQLKEAISETTWAMHHESCPPACLSCAGSPYAHMVANPSPHAGHS